MAPNPQLRLRLLTAAVLAPLFLAAILWLPTPYVMALFALVVAQGAWEWGDLAGLRGHGRLVYVLAIILLLVLLTSQLGHVWLLWLVLVLALLWWLAALAWIRRCEAAGLPQAGDGPSLPLALAGVVVLVPVWTALTVLHGNGGVGIGLLLILLGIVWGADSGAYFAGRRWGRRKLAPRISPGKTWEGAAGGVVVAVAIALSGAWLLGFRSTALLGFALLAVVTALFSIVGDLLESLLKRRRGVKDSGSLLPGHGGVLDRIDSLTAAAPVYVLGLMLQEVRL